MEKRVIALEARFDTILPTLATKSDISDLRADVQKVSAEISRWMLATMVTILGAMLAALLGTSTIYRNSQAGGTSVAQPAAPASAPAPIIIQVPTWQTPSAPPPATALPPSSQEPAR